MADDTDKRAMERQEKYNKEKAMMREMFDDIDSDRDDDVSKNPFMRFKDAIWTNPFVVPGAIAFGFACFSLGEAFRSGFGGSSKKKFYSSPTNRLNKHLGGRIIGQGAFIVILLMGTTYSDYMLKRKQMNQQITREIEITPEDSPE